MNKVDAHQHFWQPARGDYHWMDAGDASLDPLRRDHLPQELLPLMHAASVSHTVLIQAAATEAETDFMLALAGQHSWVAGVVGWVDLAAGDAVQRLIRLAEHAKLRGIRPMLQDLPDPAWLVNAPSPQVWQAMEDLSLRLDALVNTRHLGALNDFVQRHPRLPVVIDHAAKPPLRAGWNSPAMEAWRIAMGVFAAQPQVCCKFSGLLTETALARNASAQAAIEAVEPVLHFLLETFGAGRLIWGSDWPVLTLAASYERWMSVCEALLSELAPHEQARIWAGNAQTFYGLQLL